MKVQIEIEIPDGHELVSHRLSSVCDNISHGLEERAYHVYSRPAKPFLINGVPSDWPEFLICHWVARNKNGKVFGYLGDKPRLGEESWSSDCSYQMLSDFVAIYIPGPWAQSLRENPRRKK